MPADDQTLPSARSAHANRELSCCLPEDLDSCSTRQHILQGEISGERIVRFITRFLADTDPERAAECESFAEKLLKFLVNLVAARDKAVRTRCCQLVQVIFNSLGADELDADLLDHIQEVLLQRLEDKVPAVRAQAVHGLPRLCDPGEVRKTPSIILHCKETPPVCIDVHVMLDKPSIAVLLLVHLPVRTHHAMKPMNLPDALKSAMAAEPTVAPVRAGHVTLMSTRPLSTRPSAIRQMPGQEHQGSVQNLILPKNFPSQAEHVCRRGTLLMILCWRASCSCLRLIRARYKPCECCKAAYKAVPCCIRTSR